MRTWLLRCLWVPRPFSARQLAMAHLPSDPDGTSGLVSSRQFFIYEFDRSSSGLAVRRDEGEEAA